jgi:hypothetical protein
MAVGKLQVFLSANIKQFETGLYKAKKQLKMFSNTAGAAINTGLLVGVGAITAFGAASVKAFMDAEKAAAKLAQALKSTNYAAGFSPEKLIAFSGELQKISTFEDDAIQGSMAMLATFTNVQGENFLATEKAILNMSAALGTDLVSSTRQLGRALQDPLTGLSLLARNGISFSQAQQAEIKKLVQANKLQEAQKLILIEIEKKFGGMAQAQAETTIGKLIQLKNVYGDLTEEVGRFLVEGINLGGILTSIKDKISEWINLLQSGFLEVFVSEVQASFGKISAIFELLGFNIGSMIGWVSENWSKLFTNILSISVGFAKDYFAFWQNLQSVIFEIFSSLWQGIKDIISGRGLSETIGKVFEQITDKAAKMFGDIGRETEAAMSKAGISKMEMKGLDDLRDEWKKIDAEKEKRQLAIQDKILAKVKLPSTPAKSEETLAPKVERLAPAKFAGAMQKGSVEAYRVEVSRMNKTPEKDTAKNTAKSVDIQKQMLEEQRKTNSRLEDFGGIGMEEFALG